jgi:hypothetical protein
MNKLRWRYKDIVYYNKVGVRLLLLTSTRLYNLPRPRRNEVR